MGLKKLLYKLSRAKNRILGSNLALLIFIFLLDFQADANLDELLEGLGQVLGTLCYDARVAMRMLKRALKYFPCLEVSDLTGWPFDMEGSVSDLQRLLHNRLSAFGTPMYGSGTTIFQGRNWILSIVGERYSPIRAVACYGAPKVSDVAPLAPVVMPTLRHKP